MPANKLQGAEVAERTRVGATIRTIREMRGFTPDEFANEIGISRPYLANIEAGRKPLTQVLLARIAAKLDVRQVAIAREGYFSVDAEAV
jgi:transcriptional regulator with XRE-family HTH domain